MMEGDTHARYNLQSPYDIFITYKVISCVSPSSGLLRFNLLCGHTIDTFLHSIFDTFERALCVGFKKANPFNLTIHKFCISTPILKLETTMFVMTRCNQMRHFRMQTNDQNCLWSWKCPQQGLPLHVCPT